MSDARIQGYARALFEIARAEGTLDEVEDELFRFARSYESSEELRAALTDDQVPVEKRQAIVEDLLGGKATSTTKQLVSMVVGSGRGRELPAIVDQLVQRAAGAKALDVAEVRTGIGLRVPLAPCIGARQDPRQEVVLLLLRAPHHHRVAEHLDAEHVVGATGRDASTSELPYATPAWPLAVDASFGARPESTASI